MPSSPRYTVRLPAALDALVSDAVRHGQSVSDIIRGALEAYFAVRPTVRPTAHVDVSDETPPVSDKLADTVSDILTQIAALEQRLARLEAPHPPVRRRQTPQPGVSDNRADTSSDTGDAEPSFDPTKFLLGTLCPQQHDYAGTGQSLLRKTTRYCRECDVERQRARRQREAS